MKKFLIRSTVTLVAVALFASMAAYFWLRGSVADYDGSHEVPSLTSSVTILRDQNAIPHIFAETLDDAYAGLGFVHAQDRLWQLEMLRRVTQGRLAEILGEDGLQYDYLAHALNFSEMATITGERMDAKTLAAFASYVSGINAYIDGHSGAWPIEFTLIGVEPEPWTVADCVGMAAISMLGMPNWEDELVNARLEALIARDKLAEFLPTYPADAPVTYPSLPTADETNVALNAPKMASWPFHAGGFSSNTWAIHGSRTASGMPILASDPHGGLSAPIDYYLARLVGPDFEVMGASFPGFPGFMLGANSNIAWGLTDMMVDAADLYVEKFESDSTYETPDGEASITTRESAILVKGAADHVMEVRETRHGPIISDFHDGAAEVANNFGEDYAIAFASDGLKHGNLMLQAVVGFSTAQNWEDFEAALADYEYQHNFSFASVNGSIGMLSASRVPHRQPTSDGLLPAPGWDAQHDWLGILPNAAMPRTLNPDAGFVFNANNKLEPLGYPYLLSRGYSPPYRAMRIEELLRKTALHDMDSTQRIQLDVISSAAAQLLPLLLTVDASTEHAAASVTMLRNWDGDMSANRPEPLIYTAWIEALSEAIYADDFKEMFEEVHDTHTLFLKNTLLQNSDWCDDKTTSDREDCSFQLSKSLDLVIMNLSSNYGDDMNHWRWGDAHKAHFANPILTGIPLLSKLSDATVEVGGNSRTVNAAEADFKTEGSFPATFGSRYRQIIDLSDLSKSRFIIAPGVSGNIFSPYYKHLVDKWANGEYIHLKGSARELRENGIAEFELRSE